MPARLCLIAYVLSTLTVSEAFGGGQVRPGPVATRQLRPAGVPCFVTTRRRPAVYPPIMKVAEVEEAIAAEAIVVEEDAAHEMQAALKQTGALVALAMCFCAGVLGVQGTEAAGSWLTAYAMELSLSVDNLLVFTLIFEYFKTPIDAQQRVLRWGLIVAAVLRAVFIYAGLAMVESFKPVLLGFAALLVYSSAKMMMVEEEEEDLSDNQVIKFAQKYLPSTDVYDGDRFVTKTPVDGAAENGGGTLLGLLEYIGGDAAGRARVSRSPTSSSRSLDSSRFRRDKGPVHRVRRMLLPSSACGPCTQLSRRWSTSSSTWASPLRWCLVSSEASSSPVLWGGRAGDDPLAVVFDTWAGIGAASSSSRGKSRRQPHRE